jgi:dTMP kinase
LRPMERGAFFVLEGIDGSGKSTAASRVASKVRDELGRECQLTAEPTKLWTGDAVRRANHEGIDDMAEALLFVADRALHTEQIRSWMEEGKVVICDRYYASTIAYQSAALHDRMDDPVGWLWELNRPIVIGPDINFLLTIPPELALERLSGRTGRSKFEKLEYLRKVDAAYRDWAEKDGSFILIDAGLPLELVVSTIFDQVRKKIF